MKSRRNYSLKSANIVDLFEFIFLAILKECAILKFNIDCKRYWSFFGISTRTCTIESVFELKIFQWFPRIFHNRRFLCNIIITPFYAAVLKVSHFLTIFFIYLNKLQPLEIPRGLALLIVFYRASKDDFQ